MLGVVIWAYNISGVAAYTGCMSGVQVWRRLTVEVGEKQGAKAWVCTAP